MASYYVWFAIFFDNFRMIKIDLLELTNKLLSNLSKKTTYFRHKHI